MNYVATIYF